MTSAATPPSIARGIIGVSFFRFDPPSPSPSSISLRDLQRKAVISSASPGDNRRALAALGPSTSLDPIHFYSGHQMPTHFRNNVRILGQPVYLVAPEP